jgi:hypothetical protein
VPSKLQKHVRQVHAFPWRQASCARLVTCQLCQTFDECCQLQALLLQQLLLDAALFPLLQWFGQKPILYKVLLGLSTISLVLYTSLLLPRGRFWRP